MPARPTTVAECDELLARVQQARRDSDTTEPALLTAYDDLTDELLAVRFALIPEQPS